jgi:hypothetical protein
LALSLCGPNCDSRAMTLVAGALWPWSPKWIVVGLEPLDACVICVRVHSQL